jgi:hypothetical protein
MAALERASGSSAPFCGSIRRLSVFPLEAAQSTVAVAPLRLSASH